MLRLAACAVASSLVAGVQLQPAGEPSTYYWSKRGGNYRTSSSVTYTASVDLSKPAWTWPNSLDEQVRHSPLIDDEMNIYVMTTMKLRKFSADGRNLWTKHFPACRLTASPALYEGCVYLLCPSVAVPPLPRALTVMALSMDDGHALWNKTMVGAVGGDSQSLLVQNSTVIVPMHHLNLAEGRVEPSTNMWYAMDARNGKHLWDYVTDEVIWNAVPATPGDGTLLFGGSCGGAFRITFGGELLWRAGPPKIPGRMCSTGGGALDPLGFQFYTEHTDPEGRGHVAAYRVSDGQLQWEKNFGQAWKGGQYPAVGYLGEHGPLAVVVAVGDNPGVALFMKRQELQNPALLERYLHDQAYRRNVTENVSQVNAVVALEASSGKVLWQWAEEPWDFLAGAGDEDERALYRLKTHSPENPICLPDLQGIPVITGDGTVYASSSHSGDLTAIRDANGDGNIDPAEVSKFRPHKAFLNSPSVAPGMLVAAPCWGPMYVFKEKKSGW